MRKLRLYIVSLNICMILCKCRLRAALFLPMHRRFSGNFDAEIGIVYKMLLNFPTNSGNIVL